LLQRDVPAWNKWRQDTAEAQADLRGADLRGVRLRSANLRGAILEGADLRDADLIEADLRGAQLRQANLEGTNLSHANLGQADLQGANLRGSHLDRTNLEGANLSNCCVYGVSVWEVNLKDANQADLVITRPEEVQILVSDLRVAQLTNLLLNDQEIAPLIDTLTANIVLILGGFSGERMKVLDALQRELRNLHYLPIPFQFDSSRRRNTSETLSTLTHLARFVVADLTEEKDALKLRSVVPEVAVPVQTLVESSVNSTSKPYNVIADIARYPWVLPTVEYATPDELVSSLRESVIQPAEQKVKELESVRARV
jgi:hypothetical protein